LVPVRALLDVVRVELPVVVRIVDPPQEAAALLFPREVQEELHDREAVLDEEALPVVDLAVPARPHVAVSCRRRQLLALEDLRMDADDENLLVVRAVEDRDLPACREALRVTPEKVVVDLLRGRLAEAVDDDALGIDAAHHVTDRAVLATGVERLKRHEEPVRVLCRESLLVVPEHLDARLEKALRVALLREISRVRGIEVPLEDHVRARSDP